MSINPDRELVLKYTRMNEEVYEYLTSQKIDTNTFKDITKIAGPRLADSIYVMLLHAEFKVATAPLRSFSYEEQKKAFKLKNEIKQFGNIISLLPKEIQEITFTIKGRKIKTEYLGLKIGLAKILHEQIQQESFVLPAKKATKPINIETTFIQSLLPLATFLKNEHSFIDADIHRCIQDLLVLKGHHADLDFIRQRLKNGKP
jgi:hypothetical protein